METADIIHQLTHYERLPIEAIRAATGERKSMVPAFLRAFSDFADGNKEARSRPSLLFLAFHLLGEWRETSAYRPLARFLRLPRDEIKAALGGAVTETSHRVMAAVFDGDPQPLYEVILDPNADEFIRSRMLEALAMVTLRGELDREEARRFLAGCFTSLQPELDCFVWSGWQSAIAMLGLEELRPLVKEAFERGSISPTWMDFEDFEEDLRRTLEAPESTPGHGPSDEYELFGDAVEELSSWYGFGDKYFEDQARYASLAKARELKEQWQGPAVNPFKSVGRNDACPCGSGRKFKKCCLDEAAAQPSLAYG